MKILIIILFPILLFPQDSTSWSSRIPHIVLSIAYPVIAANTEWQQFKEKTTSGLEREMWARKWHATQWYERATGFSMAMAIPFHSKFNFKRTLIDSFLSGILFWNIYDGVLNNKRGMSFYYSSKTTPSGFKNFDFLKIPLLLLAITIYIWEWL